MGEDYGEGFLKQQMLPVLGGTSQLTQAWKHLLFQEAFPIVLPHPYTSLGMGWDLSRKGLPVRELKGLSELCPKAQTPHPPRKGLPALEWASITLRNVHRGTLLDGGTAWSHMTPAFQGSETWERESQEP